MDAVIAVNLLVVSATPLLAYLRVILRRSDLEWTRREDAATTVATAWFLGLLYLSLVFWTGYVVLSWVLP